MKMSKCLFTARGSSANSVLSRIRQIQLFTAHHASGGCGNGTVRINRSGPGTAHRAGDKEGTLSRTRSQNHRKTSAGGDHKDHRAPARCPGLAVSGTAGCPERGAAGRRSSVPAAAPQSSGTDRSSAAAQPRQKICERLRPLSPAPPAPPPGVTHSLTHSRTHRTERARGSSSAPVPKRPRRRREGAAPWAGAAGPHRVPERRWSRAAGRSAKCGKRRPYSMCPVSAPQRGAEWQMRDPITSHVTGKDRNRHPNLLLPAAARNRGAASFTFDTDGFGPCRRRRGSAERPSEPGPPLGRRGGGGRTPHGSLSAPPAAPSPRHPPASLCLPPGAPQPRGRASLAAPGAVSQQTGARRCGASFLPLGEGGEKTAVIFALWLLTALRGPEGVRGDAGTRPDAYGLKHTNTDVDTD